MEVKESWRLRDGGGGGGGAGGGLLDISFWFFGWMVGGYMVWWRELLAVILFFTSWLLRFGCLVGWIALPVYKRTAAERVYIFVLLCLVCSALSPNAAGVGLPDCCVHVKRTRHLSCLLLDVSSQ